VRRALWLIAFAGCEFRHGALMTDASPPTDGDGAVDAGHDAKPDAHTCPPGFMPLQGAPAASKYLTFSAQSFATAVNACKGLGTHLVQLDTQGEVDAVYTLIDQATGGGDTHLYRVVGQRDKSVTPNRWLDLSGNPLTFLPWGASEPTSLAGEDCIMIRLETASTTKVIGADQCATLHEYACECE
jgi:hypothetical protein